MVSICLERLLLSTETTETHAINFLPCVIYYVRVRMRYEMRLLIIATLVRTQDC